MANHSAVVVAGLLVLLVILVIALGHGGLCLDRAGFLGAGLGHGRAPLGGGSHLEGDIYHFGFEPEQFSAHHRLGGRGHAGGGHAGGGLISSGSRGGVGSIRRSPSHGDGPPRDRLWRRGPSHRRPWVHPRPGGGSGPAWTYWWQASPVYAIGYPGYCAWCAHCDNLDPDGTSQLCASCELNCPYGRLRPYGL